MFDVLARKYLTDKKTYTAAVFGGENFKWHYCEYIGLPVPDQGWKIHISANFSNAEEILQIALPYLVQRQLTFKHACTQSDLGFLNTGKGGITQVGKFVTIYCGSDCQLKETLNGLSRLYCKPFQVPFIVTDKRFDQNAPLFYRYGALRRNEVQNTMGVFESVIKGASGNLVPDIRDSTFILPKGVLDPFENRGLSNSDLTNKLLINKYVTFERISNSYKTETYFGIDLSREDTCIIKISKPDIEIEKDIFPRDLLRNEIHILKHLSHPHFPELREAFEYEDNMVMVTSLAEGINLFDFISLNAIQGIFLSRSQVRKLFLSILSNVRTLEEKGVLHNDLKPNNIIVSKHLDSCIIDFETSRLEALSQDKATNIKSRGYYNHQSKTANPDYYALGMILYFIETAYNISDAPREYHILERPLHYLTGKFHKEIETYISNLCGNYYHTIDAVIQDFNLAINARVSPFRIGQKDIYGIADSYRTIPQNIVDWLFTHSLEISGFTYWNSTHRYNSGEGRADINIGSSGILLFLSYYILTTARPAAKRLHQFENAVKFISTVPQENQISGLFVGEAGKILATITALLALGKFDAALLEEKLTYIKSNLPQNNDFYNGKSGIGFLFVVLYAVSRDQKHLETAMEIAKTVIAHREVDKTGIYWKDSQTQKHFIGFAHGISGIGYFLITLYRFAPRKSLWKLIIQIADTLLENAVTYSEKSKLINWPDEPDANIGHNHWCNGTAGIGNFFLALYQITKTSFYLETLGKCAHTAIKASAYMNPTMCHGLAGNINFLINYYQLTQDVMVKAEIFRLAEVLKMSGIISDNHFLFPSESPYIVTPDFWVGFSGTAYVFQRLADIDHHPDLLSIEYYQRISNDGLSRNSL